MKKVVLGLFLLLLATGCASTRGSVQMASPANEVQLARYSEIAVNVSCMSGVSLSSGDVERIDALILKHIPSECSGQFKAVNPANPGPSTLKADVLITKYDEGNAFARAMLAGLGQMHIDATVTLTDYTFGDQIAKSDVSKTFAWGGMYGGFTQIKDIEDGFATAVASSFSGKKKE